MSQSSDKFEIVNKSLIKGAGGFLMSGNFEPGSFDANPSLFTIALYW
ncbi:MAG: hypothetical protein GQF41_3004 [Candidatus Rifleibacterium amylolyticum]|nr:MAG: hypothetical protein GQF41_3004 [Candidatus Rifleibacterium amylolyticum]